MSTTIPVDENKGRRGSAIVFDTELQTISTSKVNKIQGPPLPSPFLSTVPLMRFVLAPGRVMKTQSAPKWSSHVDICVQHDRTERVAATLNLDSLGWVTNMQRLCGRYSDIYVISSMA